MQGTMYNYPKYIPFKPLASILLTNSKTIYIKIPNRINKQESRHMIAQQFAWKRSSPCNSPEDPPWSMIPMETDLQLVSSLGLYLNSLMPDNVHIYVSVNLTHWGLVTPFSDIGLGQHWLRPDDIKPLPEPMLTYHQQGPVIFIWWQFHKRYIGHQWLKLMWKLLI